MATGSSAYLDPKYAKTPNAIDIGSAGSARSYTPSKNSVPTKPWSTARKHDVATNVSYNAALATSTE